MLIPRRAGKDIVFEYTSDTNIIPDYNSYSSYEFDFELDLIDPESKYDSTEKPLSGRTVGLVITSTLAGRFIYYPDQKPTDLTDDNSHCVAYLETLPFQEGTPLTPTLEEHTPTVVATTDLGLCTPDCEVFVAVAEADTSETRVDWYLTTSLMTSFKLIHLQMRLLTPKIPSVPTTRSEQTDTGGFRKPYQSATSTRPWTKSLIRTT